MHNSYYDAAASVLESKSILKLYSPNYSTFLGAWYVIGSSTVVAQLDLLFQ
jgi:hypothetical protein